MMYFVANLTTIKNWALLILFLTFVSPAFSQTSFRVTYNGNPACSTSFSITDTTGQKVFGTGKSDDQGIFSCDLNITGNSKLLLKADPDKGGKWSLGLPDLGTIRGMSVNYDVRIEEIEKTIRAAMDAQNELLGESENRNNSMNNNLGTSGEGESELGMIGGIMKTGHTLIDSQFKLIRNSINKSCGGGAASGLGLSGLNLGFGKGKKEKAVKEKETKEKVEKEKTEKTEKEKGGLLSGLKKEPSSESEVATFPEGKKGEAIKRKATVKIQEINAEKSKIDIEIAKEDAELQKIKSKKKVKANKVRSKEIDIELLEKQKEKLDLEIEKTQVSADGKVWTEANQTDLDARKKAIKEEMKTLEKEQKKL